ncbi:MAG: SH3 domain-containing protein [Anaerolineae bacterium]
MKRVTLFALLLMLIGLLPTLSVLGQADANVITLNDASPAIDVVVTLPADTTGTVALEFSGAAVRLTDATGALVFSAADPRLHALEMNIAPNSGSHTLTVERLPGITEAAVRVTSLPELSLYGSANLVPGLSVATGQEVSLPLTPDHPGDSVNISVTGETAGLITATFPGAGATAQLVDASGVVVVESVGGHVDGINLLVDPGAYQFTMVSGGLASDIMAGVRLVSADSAGIVALAAPASAQDSTVVNGSCTATVAVSSTNLRSGPGTGYTVLGYGYRSEIYNVGGHNAEDNWLLVARQDGTTAWVSRSTAQTSGDCAALTTFNIPTRDAQPAPLIVVTQAPGSGGGSVIVGGGSGTGTSGSGEDHEHEEHEGGEGDD